MCTIKSIRLYLGIKISFSIASNQSIGIGLIHSAGCLIWKKKNPYIDEWLLSLELHELRDLEFEPQSLYYKGSYRFVQR